jgi:methionyl-tRNA synthetase
VVQTLFHVHTVNEEILESRYFKRILVTAALPYANGHLHLGHLAGAYLPADIYVRFQRLKQRDIVFICGSDEHGVPITITAEKESTTPQSVVDRYHEANKNAFERFGMSFDNYSRTSLPLHHETAREFFLDFYRKGILKEKAEKQLYCENDAMFLADRYVEGICPNCNNPGARGDQCESCGNWLNQEDLIEPKCKICGSTPVLRETKHLYFPLGAYQERLETYVEERHARDGWKDNVLQYCRSWFKDGLQDRAVTRDLRWGVPVPIEGYPDKVLYVWFDAVLGYISSTKEWAIRRNDPDSWKRYWQQDDTKYVAFIGKDNVVFHCIVFPAMLMAKEGYILPENVPANEFLNFEGQKFSKSRGWGIDLRDFLDEFPNADALRYAIAVNLPESHDSDFYLKDYQARNNNELASILGNFVNRTLTFAKNNFGNTVPQRGTLVEEDRVHLEYLKRSPGEISEFFERYRFRDGLLAVMNVARAANKYFNDTAPWKTVRENPERCRTTINICLQTVRTLAVLVEPVLPGTALKMWNMLNLMSLHGEQWDKAGEPLLSDNHELGESEILFSRIEDKEVDRLLEHLTNENRKSEPEPPTDTSPVKPAIDIGEFMKVDIRTARILACEKVKKSRKLLKISIDIGSEKRTVVAGIAEQYKPEDLVGKNVVVVANLKPAKLMGVESQGMVLAAIGANGNPVLLMPESDMPPGSTVR